LDFFSLNPVQVWELRELTRTAPGRIACRALMVLWRAEGLTTLEIAQRLDCHRDTVSLWVDRFHSLGLVGLQDEPRSGRPPKLDAALREQVETALDHAPPEEDQPCACWTLPRLRALLAARAPSFGVDTLRAAVHALGFRWRRPRLWAHKEDPETFEKQLLVELARQQTEVAHAAATAEAPPASPPVHFLYADASDHHLLAVLRSMWMRRGQQVRVATPPSNGRWTLFGGLNVLTGAFAWQAYGNAISATFLEFLAYLLTSYPQGEILLVVDNASYHTSKAVVAWLKEHPRIRLLYLPARRPDLNPMERVWRRLKDAVSANRSFASPFALGQFIAAHFRALTPAQLLTQAGVRRDFSEAT
jgi:transposase